MISIDEIMQLAHLARLKVSQEQAQQLRTDMSSIIDYVSQIAAASAESTVGAPQLRNVMREDTPYTPEFTTTGKGEQLRQAFPVREDNYNLVRKIIQKDE